MTQSEVDVSLKHDVMGLFPIHKQPRTTKSGANLVGGMVEGCIHMPLRQHTKDSNTLQYMSNMDV
jgi:hypothetical protein